MSVLVAEHLQHSDVRQQGWPDGWTNPNGKAPDSRRYAVCGDGVTASVAEWIGRRLIGEDA